MKYNGEFYIGIDLGSSSIKVALVEQFSGKPIALLQEPLKEMPIIALNKGWAEQSPQDWWELTCKATRRILKEADVPKNRIKGIGIAYQMHGLVLVGEGGVPLRNSIIWCDSRAVDIGKRAYRELGEDFCKTELLNSPSNFTASKLRWISENEPGLYNKIHKFMLPGDYLAFRFSGKINTTVSGLSEGVFWNFKTNQVSKEVLGHYDISANLVPEVVDTFSVQGKVSKNGAEESGLAEGTPILYRAGDQPNNALALNVFLNGEIAATGGTSGVLYAVTHSLSAEHCDKVNNFAHVNYTDKLKTIGKLLCINGAGIQYRWLLDNLSVTSYELMNQMASGVPIGSDGAIIMPFGNGAERMLMNKTIGARIVGLDLNRHHKSHLCRAVLEGIAFSFAYGFEIMQVDGIHPSVIKAGNDNLFRSGIFAETIATLIGQPVEIYNTTGAIGAARACVLVEGDYKRFASFLNDDHVTTYLPKEEKNPYETAFQNWIKELELTIKQK